MYAATVNEHIYSPIRQTDRKIQIYTERHTINITTHVVIGDTDVYKI